MLAKHDLSGRQKSLLKPIEAENWPPLVLPVKDIVTIVFRGIRFLPLKKLFKLENCLFSSIVADCIRTSDRKGQLLLVTFHRQLFISAIFSHIVAFRFCF